MAKPKITSKLVSFGIYTQWDDKAKHLPELQRFTTDIPAEIDIEFGMIINIKKAKGKQIHFCIDHPKVPGDDGQVMPPFTGDVYVRNNNWEFFLGDTIWAPIENKRGPWVLSIELEGKILAKKTFMIA